MGFLDDELDDAKEEDDGYETVNLSELEGGEGESAKEDKKSEKDGPDGEGGSIPVDESSEEGFHEDDIMGNSSGEDFEFDSSGIEKKVADALGAEPSAFDEDEGENHSEETKSLTGESDSSGFLSGETNTTDESFSSEIKTNESEVVADDGDSAGDWRITRGCESCEDGKICSRKEARKVYHPSSDSNEALDAKPDATHVCTSCYRAFSKDKSDQTEANVKLVGTWG